jgi:hypothetical protein
MNKFSSFEFVNKQNFLNLSTENAHENPQHLFIHCTQFDVAARYRLNRTVQLANEHGRNVTVRAARHTHAFVGRLAST